MAKKPMSPTPSKGRKYTKAEIDAINKAAPQKIDKVNEDSMKRTKQKIERERYMRDYRRKLV